MERRKAITAAAATALTMLAGAAGIALNSGIVGAGADGNVGKLTPVIASTQPIVPPPTDAAFVASIDGSTVTVPPAPSVAPSQSPPVTTSSASGSGDDHQDEVEAHDDEGAEHESDHEDDDSGHEDEHEYEGVDDDD